MTPWSGRWGGRGTRAGAPFAAAQLRAREAAVIWSEHARGVRDLRAHTEAAGRPERAEAACSPIVQAGSCDCLHGWGSEKLRGQLTSQKRQQGLAGAARWYRDLLPVDPQPGHAVSVSARRTPTAVGISSASRGRVSLRSRRLRHLSHYATKCEFTEG